MGTLHNRCRIIIGTPKRDPNFDYHPNEPQEPPEASEAAVDASLPAVSEPESETEWFPCILGLGFRVYGLGFRV